MQVVVKTCCTCGVLHSTPRHPNQEMFIFRRDQGLLLSLRERCGVGFANISMTLEYQSFPTLPTLGQDDNIYFISETDIPLASCDERSFDER